MGVEDGVSFPWPHIGGLVPAARCDDAAQQKNHECTASRDALDALVKCNAKLRSDETDEESPRRRVSAILAEDRAFARLIIARCSHTLSYSENASVYRNLGWDVQ